MEKLASSLPLHLMAVILSPDRDTKMAYLLRGIRLLHTLSELATRHARLEQVRLHLAIFKYKNVTKDEFTKHVLCHCHGRFPCDNFSFQLLILLVVGITSL